MLRPLTSIFILLTALVAAAAGKEPPKPLSPAETVKRMQLPPGFKATVFGAEPDVVQPMAMTFDDRGRLWVVECLSDPRWTTPKGYRDPTASGQHKNRSRQGADARKPPLPDGRGSAAKRNTPDPNAPGASSGHDRITIFEHTNGDGKHDKRTVFYDKGMNFTGIEYGYGGVFVTAPPSPSNVSNQAGKTPSPRRPGNAPHSTW